MLALGWKERPGEPAVLACAESNFVKMQRKDIEEQLDLLKAAINEKQPADNVINILTKLKAEVVPTEDILRVSLSTANGLTKTPEYISLTLGGHPCLISELIFL